MSGTPCPECAGSGLAITRCNQLGHRWSVIENGAGLAVGIVCSHCGTRQDHLVPYPDNPQGPGLRQGWSKGDSE
jgi:hypothetical protein